MPETKSFSNGTFCWPELVTTDAAAARAFYAALLGWELNDGAGGSGRSRPARGT